MNKIAKYICYFWDISCEDYRSTSNMVSGISRFYDSVIDEKDCEMYTEISLKNLSFDELEDICLNKYLVIYNDDDIESLKFKILKRSALVNYLHNENSSYFELPTENTLNMGLISYYKNKSADNINISELTVNKLSSVRIDYLEFLCKRYEFTCDRFIVKSGKSGRSKLEIATMILLALTGTFLIPVLIYAWCTSDDNKNYENENHMDFFIEEFVKIISKYIDNNRRYITKNLVENTDFKNLHIDQNKLRFVADALGLYTSDRHSYKHLEKIIKKELSTNGIRNLEYLPECD